MMSRREQRARELYADALAEEGLYGRARAIRNGMDLGLLTVDDAALKAVQRALGEAPPSETEDSQR